MRTVPPTHSLKFSAQSHISALGGGEYQCTQPGGGTGRGNFQIFSAQQQMGVGIPSASKHWDIVMCFKPSQNVNGMDICPPVTSGVRLRGLDKMNVGNFTTSQPLVMGKKQLSASSWSALTPVLDLRIRAWDAELHLVVIGPGLMVKRTGLHSQLCLLDDHRHLSSPLCATFPSPMKQILFLWKVIWDAAGKQSQKQMSSQERMRDF